MNRTRITAAVALGLAVTPALAGGYVVNGHAASRAETHLLASYGVQPGSWKVDGYGISPASAQAAKGVGIKINHTPANSAKQMAR